MTSPLASYREHLTCQLLDLDAQLQEMPVSSWRLPLAQSLLSEMDKHLAALNLLNSYLADIATVDLVQ